MAGITGRLVAGLVLAGCLVAPPAAAKRAGMRAFASDKELARVLAPPMKRRGIVVPAVPVPVMAMPAPPPAAVAMDGAAEIVTTAARAAPNITNTQEAGVDEGGIVKVHGRHLVVLRRGRLFTIDTAGGGLRAVDRIDAFPPGAGNGGGAWYDEMLVTGDTIAVIGYSYARAGTEVNRFRIDGAGRLRYLDTHHLRSADYYSTRNYASRLIGSKLVLYTPIPVWMGNGWRDALPAVREWRGGGRGDDGRGFRRIAPPSRIYMAEPLWRGQPEGLDTFHTVAVCDLAAAAFPCTASAVLGGSSRSFYVSGNAVYVWTGNMARDARGRAGAFVYRLPLDGGAPGALAAAGNPVDQFSFREDGQRLDVVVRAEGRGDGMGGPEWTRGGAALLQLPLASFGDGSAVAPQRAYRALPARGWDFHNRFVGRHLLYASDDADFAISAVPVDGGAIRRVALPHAVSRIDVIGGDGVAVGQDRRDSLGFSAIGLDARSGAARLEDTYFFPHAEEGENRSQAFFYRPDEADPAGTSGIMALPINRELAEGAPSFLGRGSEIAFLRRERRKLAPAGELVADSRRAVEDDCVASCVDWYGNARPIFLGQRIFALMGYELVEGRLEGGGIREARRLDFSPAPAAGRR